MLDIGFSELMLIGVVALIVIGPKELPQLFHSLGRITARARSMAREFSSAMEDAAKQSGLAEATKDLNDLRSLTSKKSMGIDALGRAADKFEKWQPNLPGQDALRAQPDPAMHKPAPKAEAPAADEVVTFRTAPAVESPASQPPASADAVQAAKPVRRTAAKTRKTKTPQGDA